MTEKEIETKTSSLIGKFKKATGWKAVVMTPSPEPSRVTNLVSAHDDPGEEVEVGDQKGEGEGEEKAEDNAEDGEEEKQEGEHSDGNKVNDDNQKEVEGGEQSGEEEGEEAFTQPQSASYCTPTKTPTKKKEVEYPGPRTRQNPALQPFFEELERANGSFQGVVQETKYVSCCDT